MGLTQAQLAERAGVSEKTLKRLESGKTKRVQPGTIARVATALTITPEQLFQAEEAPVLDVSKRRPTAWVAPAADGLLPFVSRETELQQLRQLIDTAQLGSRRVVLVQGEPGVGKSRLLDELTRRLGRPPRNGAPDMRFGRCSESPGSPPYWPWIQIFRSFGYSTSAWHDRAGIRAQDLAPLIPELQTSPSWAERGADLAERARFRLYDAAGELLRAEAERSPQLIVLDDLHCADASSLHLFEFLARDLASARITLVAAFRPASLDPEQRLLQMLGRIGGTAQVTQMHVRGLDRAAIRALVERAGGVEGSEPLVSALLEKTDGNPFYLSEIVQELRAGLAVDASPEERVRSMLPLGVQDVVAGRVARLGEQARHVLEIAAVEGRQLSGLLISEISGLSHTAVGQILDSACRARLIEPLGESGIYQFIHLVVQQAIYSRIDVHRRAQLHRAVGEAIERRSSHEPERHLSTLAYHFLSAVESGSACKGIHYAEQAGAWALKQLAFDEAVGHYRGALQVVERSTSVEPERLVQLLLQLGEAQDRAGDGVGSMETHRRALAISRRITEPELLARATLGAWLRFGQVFDAGSSDTEQTAAIETALAQPGLSPELRADLTAHLSIEYLSNGSWTRGLALSEDAIDQARKLASVESTFNALKARYLASLGSGQARSSKTAIELREIAERTGNREQRLHSQVISIAEVMLQASQWATLSVEIQRMKRLAEELREPSAQWRALGFEASLMFLEGKLDEGLRAAQDAHVLAARAGTEMVGMHMLAHRFSHARLTGDWRVIDTALELGSKTRPKPVLECARIWTRFNMGQQREARRDFEEWVDVKLPKLQSPLVWRLAVAMLSELCFELRDARRAATLASLLTPLADENVVGGVGVVFYGPVSRYLGLLAATQGQIRDARGLLADALRRARDLRARPWQLQIELDLLRVTIATRSGGDRPRADIEQIRERASLNGWSALRAACDQALQGAPRVSL